MKRSLFYSYSPFNKGDFGLVLANQWWIGTALDCTSRDFIEPVGLKPGRFNFYDDLFLSQDIRYRLDLKSVWSDQPDNDLSKALLANTSQNDDGGDEGMDALLFTWNPQEFSKGRWTWPSLSEDLDYGLCEHIFQTWKPCSGDYCLSQKRSGWNHFWEMA